jgi:hypothetical protein
VEPTATTVPEGVRINEVLPAPESTDWDGDGNADELDEWIEIYNAGETAVDVSSWLIDDGSDRDAMYTLPIETVLGPGEYLVLYRQKTGIALNDGGGAIKLLASEGGVVDAVAFGEVGADASYSRDGGDAWYVSPLPSPGSANVGAAPTEGE